MLTHYTLLYVTTLMQRFGEGPVLGIHRHTAFIPFCLSPYILVSRLRGAQSFECLQSEKLLGPGRVLMRGLSAFTPPPPTCVGSETVLTPHTSHFCALDHVPACCGTLIHYIVHHTVSLEPTRCGTLSQKQVVPLLRQWVHVSLHTPW